MKKIKKMMLSGLIFASISMISLIIYLSTRARDLILFAADLSSLLFGSILLIFSLFVISAIFLLKKIKNREKPAIFQYTIGIFLIIIMVGASFFGIIFIETNYIKGDPNLNRISRYYNTQEEWELRTAKIRQGILDGAELYPLPTRTTLNATIHSERIFDAYKVSNVFFESLPGFFVAGNLYQPISTNSSKLMPIILIPQGHFRLDRFEPDYQNLAANFAQMGAIAMIYDMVGRGESKQAPHNNKYTLTLQLWNSMRVVDFLLTIPGVDFTRIGMTGASGGGTQTFLLAAVDSRISLSAPVCMVSSFSYGGCLCENGMPIHRGEGYATNNAEIAALIAPKPLLLVSIGTDWTRKTPTSEYPFIQRIYNFYGQQNKVENAHFEEEDHDYGISKRNATIYFVAKHFDLPINNILYANGTINESENVIENPDQMRAFDSVHPLPTYALNGTDSIMNMLKALQ